MPALPRKMSPNRGLSTTLKPKSRSAQTACSRLEPVPKSGPAKRIDRARVRGSVEHEVGVLAPAREQRVLEARLRDALQEDGRDDLVGVDGGPLQRNRDAGVRGELFHDSRPPPCRAVGRALDSVPRTAVAAATSGETRCVRPPLPCRPSKLRLQVEAQRSPGASWSGFMPRHIEQPANRHSAPKSVEHLVEALGLGLEPHAGGARDDHDAHALGLRAALTTTRRPAGPRCGCWCTSP